MNTNEDVDKYLLEFGNRFGAPSNVDVSVLEWLRTALLEAEERGRKQACDYIEAHQHPIEAVGHETGLYLKLKDTPPGNSFFVVTDEALTKARSNT